MRSEPHLFRDGKLRPLHPRYLHLRADCRICPCNSVLCPGLIGSLASRNTQLSPANILTLTVSFCIGTILVLLPLGVIAGSIGRYLLFLNSSIAGAIGECL